MLVGEVERPIRTTTLAKHLEVSREHLSRQFGAGGAPNLKRVIDLTRIACAAQLLANPGYSIPTVVRVLHFASSSHLSSTVASDRQRLHPRARRARAPGRARRPSPRGTRGAGSEGAVREVTFRNRGPSHPEPVRCAQGAPRDGGSASGVGSFASCSG